MRINQPFALFVLLLTCACPEQTTPLQECEAAAFAPMTPMEFCDAFEGDVAASAKNCWGGELSQWSGYAKRVRPFCLGLVEGVRLGFLTYSATEAASCFEQYGCDGGVFCGQSFASARAVQEGESCEVPPRETSTWVFSREGNPCAPGLYCGQSAGLLVCKKQASLGATCERIGSACAPPAECLGPEPFRCKAPSISDLGEACNWPDLPCVDGAVCTSGFCVRVLEQGAPCSPSTSVCEIGFVCDLQTETCVDERRCGEFPLVGGSCDPGECASIAYCGGDQVCHVRPVAGESCSANSGGDEVVCLEGSCRSTSSVCE